MKIDVLTIKRFFYIRFLICHLGSLTLQDFGCYCFQYSLFTLSAPHLPFFSSLSLFPHFYFTALKFFFVLFLAFLKLWQILSYCSWVFNQ